MKLHYFDWEPKENQPTTQRDTRIPSIPLVFLHGMGGTGYIWRPIAASLEEHFKCIALDQRGHGQSRPVPENEPGYHALDYARDVILTLKDLGLVRFFLIGHSMGVRTALAVAHLIPEQVAGLIAVDIGITPEWGGGIGKPLAEFLQNLPVSFPHRNALKDYVFQNCPDPSIAQYLTAVAKKISDVPESWVFPFDHEALVKTIHSADDAPIPDWVMQIVRAGVRTTFLRGEKSQVWRKEEYDEQRAKYIHPLLQFEEWENCGHGLPFEQRARFISFVKKFVQGLAE